MNKTIKKCASIAIELALEVEMKDGFAEMRLNEDKFWSEFVKNMRGDSPSLPTEKG